MQSQAGYYRFPTIHQETVVFVCEDDLWTVPASGGVARRLTANPGVALHPALGPDGSRLAYTSRDEGHAEVYVMSAAGGPSTRLTYLGSSASVVGWSLDGSEVLFASSAGQPFHGMSRLYAISAEGGEPRLLPVGPGVSLSYGPDGGLVLGRNTTDLARWKRYRGGLTGDLWVDAEGDGDWRRLVELDGNVALPLWVGERVYFVSDHGGVGNLFSCTPAGDDLRQHTRHSRFYVRNISSDGRRVVYQCGADLFVFDPATDATQRIPIAFHSPQVQRKRRFVPAEKHLQTYALHPKGHAVALTVRGQAFSFSNWEGAVVQHGEYAGRYRLTCWLGDGKRLVAVSDRTGEEALEVFEADGSAPATRLDSLDIGRPYGLLPAPKEPLVAVANHRNELLLVDIEGQTVRTLDQSRYGPIMGVDWSPDGRWLAYGFWNSQQTTIIKLVEVATGATHEATRPVLIDSNPAFDPEGKYLYFLSQRIFNPVYDNLHFDLNFPKGTKPFLITLQADLPSPFIPQPGGQGDRETRDKETRDKEKENGKQEGEKELPKETRIDLDGIADRVVAFPLDEGRYGQIRAMKGKLLYTTFPVEGALNLSWAPGSAPPRARLECYDFEKRDDELLVAGINHFDLSRDGSTLIYRAKERLRVIKAGEKPKENGNEANKANGWLDLGRVKVAVRPADEWRQMYREAWRLQRDHFWTADMSGIDWLQVYERYLPLLERVATRSEFSDLLWEMQGELGTSHAYEIGGDYRPEPRYSQGLLGADLRFDPERGQYRFAHIVKGDVWDERGSSPLARAGVNVREGDLLLAVNGRTVGPEQSPYELLVNQADNEVLLTIEDAAGKRRSVTVKTLSNEQPARYREWVEANRQMVHAATGGRVGYVHIPNMGPWGYAEFHRGYLAEVGRPGLIVDVRFNGGGHVSELVLEKLARRRLGYSIARWNEPEPYPSYSLLGPMVALTNENAGSDGDIFSHGFKMLGLGPLIGKRTWGGVIGISPRDTLADGGFTTQPEYSFWFSDVGWQVENYGTDPDIEVEMRPQDYAEGRDAQLERAIAEVTKLLEERNPALPDFSVRPRLPLPVLEE